MKITLDESYNAKTDFTTLGYVGETNARTITIEDYQCDGADSYKMRLKYPDEVVYDVDINSGTYMIEGSILRRVGAVYVQILACKKNGDQYEYVKKSNTFTLQIGRSLKGDAAPIPTYEQSVRTLEKVLEAEKSSAQNMSKAESASNAAQTAQTAAEQAKQTAVRLAANAEKAAESAAQSERTAQTAAATAADKAAEISKSAEQIQKNTDDIAKLYSKSDGIVCNAEGKAITLNDSSELGFSGMRIFGRSTQDGTPSPDNPQEIFSVGDSGKISVTVTDGVGNSQTLTVSTPNGLPGIPVNSGGNYTDKNGQRWVCDDVNFERGVYVQRVGKWQYTSEEVFLESLPNGTVRFRIDAKISNVKTKSGNGYCNIFNYAYSPVGKNDIDNMIVVHGSGNIYAHCDDYQTAEDFKSMLEAKRTICLYILAEPIETPLTAEQIAAYKALHTNKPTTTITNSDSAHMAVSYTADTKTYIDNKFAELQAAIISTIDKQYVTETEETTEEITEEELNYE